MLAIVLSRRDFREYDQIISLYTKEQGKLELLARGVKKITSKQSAHLEPFSLIQATVEPGKKIDHLIKTQSVEYFSGIRSDFGKSMAAGYVVSITDKLTEVGEKDARILDALLSWLKFIEGIKDLKIENSKIVNFVDGYIVSLLHCLGFTPILDKCVVCEKTFTDIAKQILSIGSELLAPGFYFAGGGVICPSCRAVKEKIGEEIFDCGLKEVSDMAVLLKGDWRLIDKYELSDEERNRLHKLVYEFALYHSERKIADWFFPSLFSMKN